MQFETTQPDNALIQHYELAFPKKYPGHRAKVRVHRDRGGFAGYRVYLDGETDDYGGLVISPTKMILALSDLLRR